MIRQRSNLSGILSRSVRRSLRLPLLIALTAALFYLPGVWWGVPRPTNALQIHGWDVDAVTGVLTLSELYNLLLHPQPDWYVAYPLFHYGLLALVYAPYMGYLWLTGGLSTPTAAFPYGMSDPAGAIATLTVLGRLVTVLMASGVVVAAYQTGLTVWNGRAGVLAALAAALAGPMAYYSSTGNLDVPALFWCSLALLIMAKILTEGWSRRRAVTLGLVCALAVATKDQAYAALAPGFVALCLLAPAGAAPSLVSAGGGPTWPARLRYAALAAVAGTVAYVVAGAIWLSPGRFIAHLNFIRDFQNTFPHVFKLHLMRPRTVEGSALLVGDMAQAMSEALGPLAILAVMGLALLWRTSPFVRLLAIMAGGQMVLAVFPIGHMQYRYTMFPAYAAAFLVVAAVIRAGQSGRLVRLAAMAVLVIGLAWLGFKAVDLAYEQARDARYDAGAWLVEHGRPGDVVAYFGANDQLPFLPAGLAPLPIVDGENCFEDVRSGAARFVYVAADWSSEPDMSCSRFLPGDVLAGLQDGVLGYRLAAVFETRPLLPARQRYYQIINPPIEIFEHVAG